MAAFVSFVCLRLCVAEVGLVSHARVPQVRRALALAVTALTLRLGDIMTRGAASKEDAEADAHIFRCKLVPLVQRGAEDGAWQVREAVAHNVGGLCEGFGERWSALLIDLLQNMMGDADLRVKCGAICALPRVAAAIIGFDKHTKVDTESAKGDGGAAEAAVRAGRLIEAQVKAIEALMPSASVRACAHVVL